jgi:hypothetical protein
MNPEFYTDEFRNFKYLSADLPALDFYRQNSKQINSLQPWTLKNDPKFVWPHRVEFMEQVVDLYDGGTIYIVAALTRSNAGLFETPSVTTIDHPIVYKGNALQPWMGKQITEDNIPKMEEVSAGSGHFVCPAADFENLSATRVIRAYALGLHPNKFNCRATFYNQETATKYAKALREHIDKCSGAVSAISRLM